MAYQDTFNPYSFEEDDILVQDLEGSSMDLKLSVPSLDIKKLKKKIFDDFLQVISRSDEIAQVNLRKNLDILHYQERREIDTEIKILQECYSKEKAKILGHKVSDKEKTAHLMKRLYSWSKEGLKSSWLDVDTREIKDLQIKVRLNSLQNQLQEKMLSKQRSVSKKFIDLASKYLEEDSKDHEFRLKECNKYLAQCILKIDRHSTSDLKEIETEANLLLQDFAYLIGVDVMPQSNL